ncbi:hypothetical protein HKCCSP123_13870 [Rhodobacterales bacterium HKCCSP123]|nr:hypothetical protein [Rhodobacterales bacterium HKCCSP123]
MKFVTFSLIAGSVVALSACMPSGSMVDADPITSAVSGRTLVAGDAVINAGADGSLSGTLPNGSELAGAWTVRDGQWCRTLTSPEALAGTACQAAELGDGTLTLTNGDGSTTTWMIQ